MYVGPWQEYRLGQMFNEQTRIIADAVRQQVQAQIRAEQAAQPQVQLQPRRGGNGSYSSQLRDQAQYSSVASTINSPSNSVSRGRSSGSRSGMSTAGSSASSSYAPSHRTHISSAASLHATPSALSSSSAKASAAALLPPLQAAARAAVDSMQASRIRATVNHPLAHIVSTYLPDAVTMPDALSRQSSQASSASSAASSAGAIAAAAANRSYFGGNPALNYRPPPHAIPRPKKPNNSRLTAKQVAQAHREHIGKLRALYNLQQSNASAENGQAAQTPSAGSGAGTPTHAAAAADRLPSLPQLPQHTSPAHASSLSQGTSKPYVLPPSAMPQLSATSLALYGPIPDELAASLSFYAVPPAQADAATAAKRIANRLPKEEVEQLPSQPQPSHTTAARADAPSPYASLDAVVTPGQRSSRPSSREHHSQPLSQWPRSDARAAPGVRPSSRGPLLSPIAHPSAASLAGSNIVPPQQLHVSHSNSSGKLHHLPASLSPSHAAGSGATAPAGKKLSAEQQWMAQQQHTAARSASRLDDSSSRLHTPMLHPSASQSALARGSRLSTPLLHAHAHAHGGAPSRANLHSSGGVSDAGFEHEVDDLLGWAADVAKDDDSLSDPHSSQVMQVHVH